MLVLGDTVHDDNLTKHDIVARCVLDYTSIFDMFKVANIMHKCFKIPTPEESLNYLKEINADLEHSVKYYNPETNDVYALLLMANNRFDTSIPNLEKQSPLVPLMFNDFKQKEGAAFIIDKRIRNIGLDKMMLDAYKNTKDYKNHDLIWCGVNHELKSHNYWKRLGFLNFYNDHAASFYLKLVE